MRANLVALGMTLLVAAGAGVAVAVPILAPHFDLDGRGLQMIVAFACFLLLLVMLNPPKRS